MTGKVQDYKVREIDEENRVIRFDPTRHGKITGSRFYAVLGQDQYTSEFAAACGIARIYSDYEETKYTKAGEAIEPIIRDYIDANGYGLLEDRLNLSSIDRVRVERPVSKDDCGYDHFKNDPVFGGMVDGYIKVNGRRRAILEIKTTSNRQKWVDSEGNVCRVPENYILQASLYAELSDLDEIVFAVGFLDEDDYDHPKDWKVREDNFYIVTMMKKDISEEMDYGRRWFQRYIVSGVTPQWTERDREIVDQFHIKKLDFVSGNLTELIRLYASTGDESLEPKIKESLESMVTGNMKGLEYHQNGMTFMLTPNESLDIERMKADGIYEKYLKKGFDMSVTKD